MMHTAFTAMLCFCNKVSQDQSRGCAESRAQAAQHFAAAVGEYRAALRRPEALGGLADRNSVRYNYVCACVLAAGAAAGADAGPLQARSYFPADGLMARPDLAEMHVPPPIDCALRTPCSAE